MATAYILWDRKEQRVVESSGVPVTQRYCIGCRGFHDKRLSACPACGREASRFNAGLVSSRFVSALNDKAARAVREG